MITVSAMLPVTLPRFASSSQGNHAQNGAPQSSVQVTSWSSTSDAQGGDPLDFDLLAEYLLDDASHAGVTYSGMPQFDFSDANVGSGVVSPEVSEDGFPPVTDSTSIPAPVPRQNHTFAPAPAQQSVLAPAPQMAAHGMTVPHYAGIPNVAAAPFPTLPAHVPQMAPAPSQSTPGMILYQHTTAQPNVAPGGAGSKRRRTDMPTQVGTVGLAPPQAHVMNEHMVSHIGLAGRGRQKSQAQIDRRRERNRILARRTRLRKKFFFESLQKEVTDLQKENILLKDLVRKKLKPEVSKQILSDCNAMERLPSSIHEALGDGTDIDGQDFNLVRSIQRSQQCFIITDPSLQDNPIVYASDDFLNLTGYQRDEVLGRNCRFLQGTETSAQKVESVRKAISMGEDVTVTMINYTADGTAFWNKLFVAALRDAQNNIVNFIGVVVKVAAPEPEDPEAGKRLPGEQKEEGNGDDDDDAILDDVGGGSNSSFTGAH